MAQVESKELSLSSAICSCSVADPYVILLTESGQMVALKLETDDIEGPSLAVLNTAATEQEVGNQPSFIITFFQISVFY